MVLAMLEKVFVLILLFSTSAIAKNVTFSPSLGASSNRYATDSTLNESSLDVDGTLIYSSPLNITFGSYLAVSRSFQAEQKWEFSDGYISASKAIGTIKDTIAVSGLVRAFAPLSKASQDDGLQTKLFFAPIFQANLEGLYAPFIDLTYRPGYSINFHKYTTSPTGKSNTQQSLSHLLSVAISVGDVLTLTSSFTYSMAWTYHGNEKSDQFLWAQDATVSMSKNVDLSLGYQNQAGAKDGTGINSNVKPFDDKSGIFSATVGLTI